MTTQSSFTNTCGIHGDIQKVITTTEIQMTETRYRPSSKLRPHVHHRASFAIVLDGDYMEGVRRNEYSCVPYAVLYRPPMMEHWSAKGRNGAHVLFIEASARMMDYIGQYTKLPGEPSLLHCKEGHLLAKSAARRWLSGERSAPLAIEGLIYEMASLFDQHKLDRSSCRPQWLNRLVELLHEQYKEPICLQKVAHEVGYHQVYIMRVFRRYYGISIGDYIRKLRIGYTKDLLLQDEMPLVDIGLSAGFSSQAYFSTTFKRETGISPGQYRRLALRSAQ